MIRHCSRPPFLPSPPRRRGASPSKIDWIPAFAGMTVILATAILTSCSKKPSVEFSLPKIPAKTLKDPSGLAFDGTKFYVADWASGGLLELGGPGRFRVPLSGRSRFIQVVALGPERLMVETDEGRLYLVHGSQKGSSQELKPDFERKPGSLICWDGLYVRLAEGGRALAATLLGSGALATHPNLQFSMQPTLGQGSALSWACGWNQAHVLMKEGDDYSIVSQTLSGSGQQKRYWTQRDLTPLAIAAVSKNQLAVLCRREAQEGAYELSAF